MEFHKHNVRDLEVIAFVSLKKTLNPKLNQNSLFLLINTAGTLTKKHQLSTSPSWGSLTHNTINAKSDELERIFHISKPE